MTDIIDPENEVLFYFKNSSTENEMWPSETNCIAQCTCMYAGLQHVCTTRVRGFERRMSWGSVYFSAIQIALISKQYVLWEIACSVQKSNYILASVFGFWRNDTEILKHCREPFMLSRVTAYYSKSRSTSLTGSALSRHGVGQYP